jgi:hypothetical protein
MVSLTKNVGHGSSIQDLVGELSKVDIVVKAAKDGEIISGFTLLNVYLDKSCRIFIILSTKNEHSLLASRKLFELSGK